MKISIPSKIESIDEVVVKSVEFAKEVGFAEDAIFGIDMAVREAVANAVKHGNKTRRNKEGRCDVKQSHRGIGNNRPGFWRWLSRR